MNRFLAAALLCALAGCQSGAAISVPIASTAQVQAVCGRVDRVLEIAGPLIPYAPAQVAAKIAEMGARACGTPEYAAARNVVVAWLDQRGIKAN